jgi:hypothetical protein
MPGAVRSGKGMHEQKMPVRDLIRRVELLMSDERYPPLYNCKVDLKIPFRIRYPRP